MGGVWGNDGHQREKVELYDSMTHEVLRPTNGRHGAIELYPWVLMVSSLSTFSLDLLKQKDLQWLPENV